MSGLFEGGLIALLILPLVALEAAAIWIWHRRTGAGVAPADLLPNLLAGAALLVAVRLAATGAWWGWLALALTGALLAHAADLRRRWRHAADLRRS